MIKVLLIGAAFSADLHMDAYSRIKDRVQIAGIADKDTAKIHALAARYGFTGFAAYDSYETAIKETDCDMVDICMPNFLHCDVALKALEMNRHIIVEKPLATTLDDAQKIIDAAKAKDRRVFYAEDWLFSPALSKALQIAQSGQIGKINYIRARECHNGSHSPFAQTIKYCGGGAMIHLGIHPVCFVLALKNNEWQELVAMTTGGLEDNHVHKKMEGEDWAAALIRFKDGTSALLEANYVSVGGMEDYIDFYGETGCLHVDLTFSSAVSCFSEKGLDYTVEKADVTTGWSRPAVDEKYNLGYVEEIKHFVDCCEKNIDAKVGLRGIDGLEALKVINLIYKSAREGKKIVNEKYFVK